jgi:hypothetical protein
MKDANGWRGATLILNAAVGGPCLTVTTDKSAEVFTIAVEQGDDTMVVTLDGDQAQALIGFLQWRLSL